MRQQSHMRHIALTHVRAQQGTQEGGNPPVVSCATLLAQVSALAAVIREVGGSHGYLLGLCSWAHALQDYTATYC
jgi:hypothetical protein